MTAGRASVEQAKDGVESARAVGLRYTTDARQGIRREHVGNGFRYRDQNGKIIRDRQLLERINSLAIPPAWTDVWICADPTGHLQATGRDARGRKQHRYHVRWREIRDETKYARMLAFAKAQPRIRRRIAKDLCLPGLPRNKVLATVVRLLEVSLIRVGNDEYARENESFGLTTMRNRHVEVNGSELRFHFRGKGCKWHEVDICDRRSAKTLAKALKQHVEREFKEGLKDLRSDEGAVLALLRQRLAAERQRVESLPKLLERSISQLKKGRGRKV